MSSRLLSFMDRHAVAKAEFRPEGAHRLHLSLGGANDLVLSVGEVERLQAAFAAFKIEQTFEDGRPGDRTSTAFKALGEF